MQNPNFVERKLESSKIFHADELCTNSRYIVIFGVRVEI